MHFGYRRSCRGSGLCACYNSFDFSAASSRSAPDCASFRPAHLPTDGTDRVLADWLCRAATYDNQIRRWITDDVVQSERIDESANMAELGRHLLDKECVKCNLQSD